MVSEQPPPAPPWELVGECVACLVKASAALPALPAGLRAVPGPLLVTAARFTDSPVGPYVELAVAVPARAGACIGMCITTMAVDSPASRLGGRLHWGFPKELGALVWTVDGDARSLRWQERALEVRGSPMGPTVPVVAPVRSLQRGPDGLVVSGGRLRGRGRWAQVEVVVPAGDPLAGLAGTHCGVVVSGLRLVVGPARRDPRRAAIARRTPGPAPEAALSWGGAAPPGRPTGD